MAIDRKKLLAEFPPEEVQIKAQTVSKDKRTCLAVPYIDARQVQERLTSVFGVTGWSVTHQVVTVSVEKWEDRKPTLVNVQGVKTTLSVVNEEQAAVFEDFGYPEGEQQLKGAASDGLKRAAVHLGVAAYLYRMPKMWGDYNADRRKPVADNLAELLEAQGGPPARKSSKAAPRQAPPAQQQSQPDGTEEQHYCTCGNLLTAQDMEDCASLKIPPSCASCRARAAGSDPSAVCSANGCGKDLTAKEQAFCKSRRIAPLCYKHQQGA